MMDTKKKQNKNNSKHDNETLIGVIGLICYSADQ